MPSLGPSALAPATLRALRRRAAGAPAVVAHGSRTLPACVLALAGRRTPIVYRSIGDPAAWAGGRVRRLRTRALLGRTAAVTALWPAAADAVHDLYGVPRTRLHVLPNGVPADRCPVPDAAARETARAHLGLPAEAPVVAAIGALVGREAGGGRHRRGGGGRGRPPAGRGRRARAAGGRAPGRRRPSATGCTSPVCCPARAEALAAADVVVSCSRTEGMPGVLIEAGLSGRPAVATDVGGVAQIVRDGETGLLVRPGDVSGLTTALERALDERSRLGAAARAHCLATFEIGAVADGWADLLRTLGLTARSRA